MGVKKDSLRPRLTGFRSRKYTRETRGDRFFCLAAAAAASRFHAQESDSSRACVLSDERCGRLSSICMYFPLFPVIIFREEKLSRDLSADASSGNALSNLRTREPGDLDVGFWIGFFKHHVVFGNALLTKGLSRHCFCSDDSLALLRFSLIGTLTWEFEACKSFFIKKILFNCLISKIFKDQKFRI